MDKQLREAFQFFHANAGCYIVGERAVGALALAKAERAGHAAGLVVQWEHDDCPYDVIRGDAEPPDYYPETLEVASIYRECRDCRRPDGVCLASLGGIADATDDYRRVVEAELFSEALAG